MLCVGAGCRHAEPSSGAGRLRRPHGRIWGGPDRDGLSQADLGRAAAACVVGGRAAGRAAGACPRQCRARASGGRWTGLHGVHGRSLRPRRQPASSSAFLDGPAPFREADEISATGEPVLRYVSGRVSPEWMLPKALWLKRNEAATYDQADRIVECTDWMMFRLTGEWTLSLNHVAVKWNYARPDGGWPTSMLAGVNLVDLLEKWPPRIVPLGKGESRLSARAAADLGLSAGIPVAQGGIDAYLGMLGLGATKDGDVAVIVGSSTCHLAQSRTGVFGSGAAGCYPDATVEGLYTLEAGQTATGSILDWYRRHFAASQEQAAQSAGYSRV